MIPTPALFLLAIFIFIFLFWRSLRHELVESNMAFDLAVVGAIGAFIFGRIFEFVLQSERFAWDLEKLVFFNVYPGFNLYGALFGAALFSFFYLKRAKTSFAKKNFVFWQVGDLACAPLVLAQAVWALGVSDKNGYFITGIIYLAIFWILKRLEKRKRHLGFFACFYLVSISSINVLLSYLVPLSGVAGSQAQVPLAFLIFGLVSWYTLAKRSLRGDIRGFFAQVLLLILAIKRVVADANEAGKLAKVIILLPYRFLRWFWSLIRLVFGEIILSVSDLLYVLGLRKSSRY